MVISSMISFIAGRKLINHNGLFTLGVFAVYNFVIYVEISEYFQHFQDIHVPVHFP
ncbi:hypothetical protein D3C87_1993270 [compost metagenome]